MQHVYGQVIALLNAVIGSTLQCTEYFYKQSLPFTAATTFFLFSLPLFVFKSARQKRTKKQQLLFLACGVLDFTANAFLNLGFQYANVASVLLLLSLSTPFAMIFSFLIIKTKFNWVRILLACLSVVFGIIYVLLDSETTGAKNIILGDIFGFVGSILYALGSVVNQMGCEGFDSICFLANMAPGGVVVGIILAGSMEYSLYQDTHWEVWLIISLYGLEMIAFYYVTVLLLQKAAAVYFNLCLLISNVYSFIIAIALFKSRPKWYIAFPIAGLMTCTILYFWYDDKDNKKKAQQDEQENQELQPFIEEETKDSDTIVQD